MDASYYLHLLPLVYFLAWAVTRYPTEQKFNDLLREFAPAGK